MTIREFLDVMNDVLDQLLTAYEDAPEVEIDETEIEGSTETTSEEIDETVDDEAEESNLFSVYKEIEDQVLTAVEGLGEEADVSLTVSSVEILEDGTVNVTINVNGEDQIFTV